MMNRILRQIDAAGEASKRTTAKIFEKIEQEGEGVERMTRKILERLDEVERASRIVGRKGQERMNTLDGTAAGAAIRKLANGFQRFSQDVMAHLEEARQWRERVGEE
jgi:HAMP domain-containing protein